LSFGLSPWAIKTKKETEKKPVARKTAERMGFFSASFSTGRAILNDLKSAAPRNGNQMGAVQIVLSFDIG